MISNKLTIITINRNNSEGLKKTMNSVFSQSFLDFEYIIIDGASTDDSLITIQQFNNSILQYLCWISEPDTGVYNAMNKGIRMATGEYLLFLNSGDFLVDNEVLKNVFSQANSADILCGRCNISNNGEVIHTTSPPENITFGTLYNTGLAHQATFIKRSLFDKLGLYDESFKYNADIEFWYRSIILNRATTQKINFLISDYNLDGISSTQNQNIDFLEEHKRILSHPLLLKFIPDYEIWNQTQKELRIMHWIKSKSILYIPLKQIYKLAHYLNAK